MNIYIPIEVKARDLEGRFLLAMAAAEHGHEVVAGRRDEVIRLAASGQLPPGLLHMKSITGSDEPKIEVLRRRGHILTVQDEEHGLLYDSYDHFAKNRFSEYALNSVERVFCWGQFDYDGLTSHAPGHRHKMICTGSPRVDFWRPEFDAYYTHQPVKTSRRDRPYVLVSSSFLFAHSPLSLNHLLKNAEKYKAGIPYGEWTREKFLGVLDYDKRLRDCFARAIQRLADQHPNVDIIVRPHPEETLSGWRHHLTSRANIKVIRQGSIGRWIRGATAILHNGCTSALEATVSGKPVFAYRPLQSDSDREFPNRISQQCYTEEQLLREIDPVLQNAVTSNGNSQTSSRILPEEAEQRLSALHGELAADRMVREMESLDTTGAYRGGKIQLGQSRFSWATEIYFEKLRKTIKNQIRGKAALNERRFPYLRHSEVLDITTHTAKALGRFETVGAKKMGTFVYHLQRNHR